MKKILSVVLILIMSLVFTGCDKQTEFEIGITIPAHTEDFDYIEDFIYSNEEISTNCNYLILSIDSDDDFGRAEIVLKPIEYEEENAYERMLITPGKAVKIDVEKGAWFKIGVAINNDTDEDMIVYVDVKNVDVRIE